MINYLLWSSQAIDNILLIFSRFHSYSSRAFHRRGQNRLSNHVVVIQYNINLRSPNHDGKGSNNNNN